jgi:hypothetical protein
MRSENEQSIHARAKGWLRERLMHASWEGGKRIVNAIWTPWTSLIATKARRRMPDTFRFLFVGLYALLHGQMCFEARCSPSRKFCTCNAQPLCAGTYEQCDRTYQSASSWQLLGRRDATNNMLNHFLSHTLLERFRMVFERFRARKLSNRNAVSYRSDTW